MPDIVSVTYLLFVDNGLTDHDLTIRDFVGQFASIESALQHAGTLLTGEYPPSAAIIKLNEDGEWKIIARTADYCHHFTEFVPGWIDESQFQS